MEDFRVQNCSKDDGSVNAEQSYSIRSPTVYEKSFGSFNLLGRKPKERGLLRYDVTVSYIPPGKEKLVHRFQLYLYKDWDDNDLPGDNKRCLELLEFIQEFRTEANGDKPIVIQSIDGSAKLGVLLAVMNGSVQVLGERRWMSRG